MWVWWELRCTSPLVDLRVLKLTGVWQGAVVWLAIAMGTCVPATVIPYLFQTPVASGFGFGKSIFAVSLVLAVPAIVMVLASPAVAPMMRLIGPKRTVLAGVLFGLAGFGLAFAHSSIPVVVVWLALTGITGAWAGTASFAVAAEAVPPERGILISTIYNTAGGSGAAVASAVAGYVLTLREVIVPVVTPEGVESRVFPADETITWSALIVGVFVLAAIVSVSTIKSRRQRDHDATADPAQAAVDLEV
jgi:MFS family permease